MNYHSAPSDSSPLSSPPGAAFGGAGIIREILSIMDPPPRLWSSFFSSLLVSPLSLSFPLMAFLLRPRAADRSLSRSPPPELISAASSFLAFLSCLRFLALFNPALEAPPTGRHKLLLRTCSLHYILINGCVTIVVVCCHCLRCCHPR